MILLAPSSAQYCPPDRTKVTGSKLPTTLSREEDNESCLRQFEHFCRAPSAGGGEDILLGEEKETTTSNRGQEEDPYRISLLCARLTVRAQ
jgi:hypothetical protein